MDNLAITHAERGESVNMLLFKPYSTDLAKVESFNLFNLDLSVSGRLVETFDLISINT